MTHTDVSISYCLALSQINREETIDVLNYFVKLEHQKYLDRSIVITVYYK